MVNRRKNIIILGAGFAGLKIAQTLQRSLNCVYKVTIIDKRIFNLYTPDLYEIASAFSPEITDKCLINLKETIAAPIGRLIDTGKIKFLHDEVLKIDPKKRSLKLKKGGIIKYDILACTLGAATDYFGIPGLKEHSFPMKTIRDGIAINCHIDQCIKKNWKLGKKKDITITIGGGGATGVETAAELRGALRRLSKKYNYPLKNLKLRLIEGGPSLASLPPDGTKIILKRFKKLGIRVHINSLIKKVTEDQITIKTKTSTKSILSDMLIWTGGVMINPIVARDLGIPKTRGAILVNQFLQSRMHPEIFAAGDDAYFPDPETPGRRTPLLAQLAIDQGAIAAKNILAHIHDEPQTPYVPKSPVYLLPLGGRYALMKTKNHLFRGRIFWYLRRLIGLKYILSILPFFSAIKMWRNATKLFLKND